MFKTNVGALADEQRRGLSAARNRAGHLCELQERARQLASSRSRSGSRRSGKSFRNEITPRNFTFRSREFEQMEIEFFCHPASSPDWYQYWRDRRMKWYIDLGLATERLRLREHDSRGAEPLLVGHCRYRVCLSVPGRRRVRRTGRHRSSRRLRSAQSHGRKA